MHTPVLLKEVIDGLGVIPGGLYIDATGGAGGYTSAILEKEAQVLTIDWDPKQVESLKYKFKDHKNAKAVEGNFADIEKIAKENNFFPADGVVFDLGLSMTQLKEYGRGLSYNRPEESLDMRISPKTEITAGEIIRSSSEDKLYEIFAGNSEEINSRAIARYIISARQIRPIEKVGDLLRAINQAIGREDRQAVARIFQALRIEVNDEFENLKKGLKGAFQILKHTGKVAIVTFHSIEDRIVKNYARENGLKFVNKKVIRGRRNLSFERSAKLRIISF